MGRPKEHTLIYYDYHDCSKYLQAKHQFKERGFIGFGTDKEYWTERNKDEEGSGPYRDFWHWVIDKAPEISNGSYFVMHEEWAEDLEPDDWRKQILDKYLEEFGKDSGYGTQINFYVWW